MDCLQPPLEESPPGRWHCPLCPPLTESSNGLEYYNPDLIEEITDSSPSLLNPSSSKRQGKRKATSADDDEDVMDEDLDDGSSFVAPTPQSRRRRKPSKKGGSRHHDSDDEDDGSSSPIVSPKRPRIRITSPIASRPRMVVRLRLPNKGKGHERDEDEGPQKGLFDDILAPDDRDTSKTVVEAGDKHRFEKSRAAAEVRHDSAQSSKELTYLFLRQEKLAPSPAPVSEIPDSLMAGSGYRPLRSSHLQHPAVTPAPAAAASPGMSASPVPSTPAPTVGLRIRTIRFGEFDIQTWFDAPFPEEYANIQNGRLWICEFCLKYMKSRFVATRHRVRRSHLPPRVPPFDIGLDEVQSQASPWR